MAIRPRIEPADSDGAVAIHEFDVPAGVSLPVPHSHDVYEETIYGVKGTVTFTVEGTPRDISPAVIEGAGGGPPDLAAIGDVMRRHGLTPAI
jgi:quercetin dioxygenase-like cupin family protein